LVLGEIIISYHIDHKCTEIEANCLICIKINVLRNFLKTLKIICVCLYLAALFLSLNWNKLKYFVSCPYRLSPVFLKVRINS